MTKNIEELEQEEAALAQAVRSSAQQIWQAGLGAFVKAQQAGGHEFSRLVRDGSALQKRARQVDEVSDTVARKTDRASRRGSSTWGKLEQVFEERVARALATIGAPSQAEMAALVERVAVLEQALAALLAQAPEQAAAAAPALPAGGDHGQ
jgi:poly(hydroxyalkanoate) granule-associated protein